MVSLTAPLPFCTHRYALFVSYLGSRYNGSQRLIARENDGQQDTIQEALEWSLESFLPKKRCRLTASSRTDKGVHALMNCFTVPLMDFGLPTEVVKRRANVNLFRKHHDIVINEVLLVPSEFHPRKSATSREYIYRLAVLNHNSRPKNLNKQSNPRELLHLLPSTELYRVLPIPRLDYEKAIRAIEVFRGEHNFTSFAVHDDKASDPVRHLEVSISEAPTAINLRESPRFTIYELHFKSRAFLHNQIRRIVGSIITYAAFGLVRLEEIKYMLDNPSPSHWKPSVLVAEPWGLYLSRINYDKSAFENCIKTSENEEKQKIEFYPSEKEMSDDSCDKHE